MPTTAELTVDVEMTEDGELRLKLPEDVLATLRAHKRVRVRLEGLGEGEEVVASPGPRFGLRWAPMSPEERSQDFLAWVESHTDTETPDLPDEAFSRETIYD